MFSIEKSNLQLHGVLFLLSFLSLLSGAEFAGMPPDSHSIQCVVNNSFVCCEKRLTGSVLDLSLEASLQAL